MGDKRAIVSSYCNLPIYHMDIDDLETAKKEIDKAVKLVEEIKVQDYLHDAYDAAIEIYTKSQDYKTANEFFHKIRKLDKKLFDESMTTDHRDAGQIRIGEAEEPDRSAAEG
jgi:tetratricopeptide (TPR) repeat protein